MAPRLDLRRRLLVGGVLPLALGAGVYLLLRPAEAWFLVQLARVPAIGPGLRAIRAVTLPLGRHVPPRVLDVLPDLAWAFAVGAVLAIAWRGKAGRAPLVWCALGALMTIGYELAQRWAVVPGTFDPRDLAAQAAGYALGWLLHPGRVHQGRIPPPAASR